MNLEEKLNDFASRHEFLSTKGPLSVALVVTDLARNQSLPLDPSKLLTKAGGQVKGLGKGAVQRILKRYGISKVLASEGGRTSRGSIGNMRDYVSFLNDLHSQDQLDLDRAEKWWIQRVQDYFNASPFRLKLDPASSLRSCLATVLREAARRQRDSPGSSVVGAVMQHLIGAKLEVLYPEIQIEHHGYSAADAPGNRSGDFLIGDCSIHVTSAPTESLIEKCCENLNQGLRPLIVSSSRGALFADSLASNSDADGRVDILDIEQFLVGNLFEWTKFEGKGRRESFQELVSRYNGIVENCETDPSLKICIT